MAGIERKGRKCWSRSEDKALRNAVNRRGPHRWAHVAGEPGLERRTPKSCRLRWLNHLNPAVVKERFREEESRAVALGYVRHGPRWAHIARELRGRTDSAVKNHWNNYLRQRFVRLLSDILQTPQVSDIRAAAAFGVGPTMLKAAIMSNAPPFSRIEGSHIEKTQTEECNPSECVSGHQSHSSEDSEGPDNNNEIIQSLYPEANFSRGTQNEILDSRLQNSRKLPTIEEFMNEAALEDFNPGLVSVAKNQLMRKTVQFQSQHVEEDFKNGGNLRSWRKSSSFNLSPLDMFASCTGINNSLNPTPNPNTEPITSDEVTECEGRRSNNEIMSPTSFSSCSTNMFRSRPTENGLEIGIEKNTIQSSGNIFSSLIGNCSYKFPSSSTLRQSSQHSEIDLYHDSFRNIDNNSNNAVNKNHCSTSFPTNNFLNNVHPLKEPEDSGEDLMAGNQWNPVALSLLSSSGGDDVTPGGINQCGIGGFSTIPFYSTAEIVPSSNQIPNFCTKEDEPVNLSQVMETLLTLLNSDVDAARQFLENLSDSQRSQIEEHLYQSSGSL